MTLPVGPHIVPYVDSKKGQSLIGKKVLPPFNNNALNTNTNANKKPNKIYVSKFQCGYLNVTGPINRKHEAAKKKNSAAAEKTATTKGNNHN